MKGASPDDGTADEELLADLFDDLLQEILEGRTPDLATYHPDRPDLRDRIRKTWALACSVAGRREPSRPVLGGYEIVRELGHGGMGTVYLARHQILQREVAIKVLPHSLALSPRAKQRFLEEARSLARLRHGHVVQIHRVIDHAEMLAFEMEYIDGPSLQSLILSLRQKPKPMAIASLAEALATPVGSLGTRSVVEWLVRLGIDIARALGEVHRHGLVHRDVKPSNILLRANGQPVLADFGLARLEQLEATHSGAFAGTPVYAAPERLRDGDNAIDGRADVYSLAVTLYEALTLSPPFAGSSTHEVLRRIENGQLPSLRKQAPQVPRDLEIVLAKAMEPDPRHRYASADEFADDLDRLLLLQPIHARPAGVVRRVGKFLRRHQRVCIAAAAGALVVTGAIWPVMAHTSARAAARERSQQAMHVAREQLLCPEHIQVSWMGGARGAAQHQLRRPTLVRAQLDALERALTAYRDALAADDTDTDLGLEVGVATVAAAVRHQQLEPSSPAPQLDGTACDTALCREILRRAAREGGTTGLDRLVLGAGPRERYAAGLLAFLLGDLGASRSCWEDLPELLPDHPLLEACMALQLSSDGFPERAFPRLFHAAREFPNATAMPLAIAEAALFSGDAAQTATWLERIPVTTDASLLQARRALLQADLLVAQGDYEAAQRDYRQLVQLDPSAPEPVERLARVALLLGENDTAHRLLQSGLDRWPDHAPLHRDQARLCLLRRDIGGYLREVRYVLSQDLGDGARRTAAELADVLRLGGLRDTFSEFSRRYALGSPTILRDDSVQLTTWLPKTAARAIAMAGQTIATWDRANVDASHIEKRPIAVELRTAWLTALRLPPVLGALPLPVQRAVVGGIPLLLVALTDYVSEQLLPYQQSLGSPLLRVNNPPLVARTTPGDVLYGQQILRASDLDGDTLEDFVVAAPTRTNTPGGFLEVRNRQSGSLLHTWRSDTPANRFARSIAVLADVDGDLCADLAIGMPALAATGTGLLELRSGRTGARLWSESIGSATTGEALAALDDVDGDGVQDLVVGAPPGDVHGQERGRAFICSGATGAILHELVAERAGVWFGAAVACAGDVDGDGCADVVVGGNRGSAPGLVSVFSGATGRELVTITEQDVREDFGATVAGIGDIDGDGRPDVAVGAPGFGYRGRETGRVHLLSSRTGNAILQLRGDRAGEGFGYVLCPLPTWVDKNTAALAVSAKRGGPVGTGYVRVFAVVTGMPMQTLAGNLVTEGFGSALAAFGDHDGDGYPELGFVSKSRSNRTTIWALSFAATFVDGKPPRKD